MATTWRTSHTPKVDNGVTKYPVQFGIDREAIDKLVEKANDADAIAAAAARKAEPYLQLIVDMQETAKEAREARQLANEQRAAFNKRYSYLWPKHAVEPKRKSKSGTKKANATNAQIRAQAMADLKAELGL